MPTPLDNDGLGRTTVPARREPAAAATVALRYPTPVPAGTSIVDHILTRQEPLLIALDAVLASPVGVLATTDGRQRPDQRTSELLGVDPGTPLLNRCETIIQRHPDNLYCHGVALYNVLAYRLPPALRHRLHAEPSPLETALHRHGSVFYRALITSHRCSSDINAVRQFVIGDEHGPIAHVLELLWSRGDDLDPTVIAPDHAAVPHACPPGWTTT